MRKRSLPLAALLLALSMSAVRAEAGPGDVRYHYDKGVALFEKQKYGAAQAEFEKAARRLDGRAEEKALAERTSYYTALCAARMGQDNAQELLERFLFEYPFSIYANDIRFASGVLSHEAGDFRAAYDRYRSVDPYELDFAQFDEYNFRTGYAAYMCGDTDAAYGYFKNVSSDPLYKPHATYYVAYIDYSRGQLGDAKRGFRAIASEPAYEPVIPFYLLQIEFKEGNYDYVIDNGVPLLARSTEERQKEISRIVSEAYFHRGEYPEALAFMDNYAKLGGAMGREETYLAGYCEYAEHLYDDAIDRLSQVASGGDELAQNASFHLADAYLQTGDRKKAMSAFHLASSADFDPAIREEALFNYGKLLYEQGGGVFNEAITVLDDYIRTYPDSPRVGEAREILLAAYFNSRNYDAAYEAIKLVPDPDNNVKMALQKIAYFRALEYFEAGDYDRALELFDVSDANRYTAKYTALTKYWRAETFVKKGDYARAEPLYRSYISLSPRGERENTMTQYNLAYCLFNAQKWGEAGTWFDRFVSAYTLKDAVRADAFNRLGDVAFAQREYYKAIGYYDKAIALGSSGADYARFQRAVMLGLADKYDRKVESLVAIIGDGKSEYVDDAMFELGRTYKQHERFNEAAAALKRLVAGYPQSPYCLSALSELGLIYQNLGDDQQALKYYKEVVDRYPSSPQAKDAMLGIKNIYVDRNEVDSYFAYAQKSGIETNVTVVERDSLNFVAADKVYQNGDYARALPLMDNYLRQYPKGVYRADALYALGDCSLHEGNRAAALAAFEEVGAMPSNRYQSLALQKAASMRMEDKDYAAAAELYKTLIHTALQKNVIAAALDGYLKAVGESGDVAAMDAAADEVLASTHASDDAMRTAHFFKGKSLQASGDADGALAHYRKAAEARSRDAAEARYQIVAILFAQNKLDAAEKEVFAFSEANLPYQYWMGKAFLILGDIYVAKNDAFQAKATYQSIVDGYSDKTDGVVDEARQKIEALK
ncbi:tetratricopeptide repeat protein [uncultured Alistipes sp.]|uniref:tetratricopeptide repeat protein n=1 Tax=uncultured Alistipes sp. TaxID=538949 RepID=UPI0026049736|nr:tetratricopeptide repeat protein [uncultured Alistipes sp.]